MAFLKRLETLSELWKPFTADRISLYAAGASFYILLSILPAAVFLLALLPQLPGVMDAAMEFLRDIIPSSMMPLAEELYHSLTTGSSLTLMSLSVLTILWSASKGIMALMDGLNAVLGQADRRSFLLRRIQAIIYFLLLTICLVATLLFHVLGQHILGALLRYLPGLSALWDLLLQGRIMYTLPLLTLLFTLLYRVLPARRVHLRYCVTGGVTAAALWLVVSALFSIYVDYAASRQIYGSLGFLIFIMLWLHLCILILLASGVFSVLLERGDYHPVQILKKSFSRHCS